MPKRDKENLESFFRKVAGRPDIPFDEKDWKRLEARLNAEETLVPVARRTRNKLTGVVVLAVLIMSSFYWFSKDFNQSEEGTIIKQDETRLNGGSKTTDGSGNLTSEVASEGVISQKELAPQKYTKHAESTTVSQTKDNQQRSEDGAALMAGGIRSNGYSEEHLIAGGQRTEEYIELAEDLEIDEPQINQTYHDKVLDQSIQISPAMADENKQKANIELPDAEERGGDVTVSKESATDKAKLSASPRLSLLLSLAPDFSSIAFNQYTDPGEAFGVMLHYHVKSAWSFSIGVVKSNKKYTGDGEDYHPPKGYWKHYTNGIIPTSVDGSCSILEIPVMVQYTVATVGRSKFLLGAGASSYIMLDESYRYNFEQPNPGAREGWDSGSDSGFLFNMINFTIGYEYQILPGFKLGLEPYIKIPIEEIGWSNLKLFSTGASLTLRYNVLNKKNSTLSTRSRGPD